MDLEGTVVLIISNWQWSSQRTKKKLIITSPSNKVFFTNYSPSNFLTARKRFSRHTECMTQWRRWERNNCECPFTIGGHRHRSQCRQYPISDIDICYSDIGDKYVGLKNVIPISEVFRYWHQSSFRYPTLKKKKYFTLTSRTHISQIGKQAL